jgi:NTE family protein
MTSRRLGLALGGGGVRGLAHILVLELLDELKLKPCVIAGTSIGALFGALYASGMSGMGIHRLVDTVFLPENESRRAAIRKRVELLRWVGPPHPSHGGLIEPEKFLRHLLEGIPKATFEDLDIPLHVIATDFWSGEEVVFDSGDILPAIRASIAIPGLLAPVSIGGRVLVDGGLVNLVPYNHLGPHCDFTIAVDVGRSRKPGRRELPGVREAILGAFEMMQSAALDANLASNPPDILVRPSSDSIHILDFARAYEVFEQAKPAIENLRLQIEKEFPNSRASGA